MKYTPREEIICNLNMNEEITHSLVGFLLTFDFLMKCSQPWFLFSFFFSPLFHFISPPSEAHFLPIAGWCLQSSILDPCLHWKHASGLPGSIQPHSSPEFKTATFPHFCVLLTRQTQYSLSWSHFTHLQGSLLHSSRWLTASLPWQQGARECVSKAFSLTLTG